MYSLTNPHGETTTWSRDGAGRLSKQPLSTGSYTDYGYDSQGRNTSITHKKSNGTVISQESYAFDPVGNMSSKTVDGVVTTYGYDNADQLIAESRSGYAATYTYDGNGNRLSKTLNGVVEAYTYDDGDKMLSAGNKSYTYDLAGQTKTVTSPAGLTTLNYDEEGRLTQVSGVAGYQSYSYNGLDARRTKTIGGTTNTFKRMGASPTAPVIKDSNATYTPGVSERRGGVSKWAHSDYLRSAKQLTNSSESVTDTKQYDAFGMQTGTTGSTPTPFGFAGGHGYQSDETGLQLLGHRYYDPSTGRFLTRDPIKDGRNWYGYCENNPAILADPNGLLPQRFAEQIELMEMALEAAGEAIPAGIRALGTHTAHWFMKQPPAVQRIILIAMGLVEQVADDAMYGPGRVGGIYKHSAVEGSMKAIQASGKLEPGIALGLESSYIAGRSVSRGAKGSVRCDLVVFYNDVMMAILDYKFGKAVLSPSRAGKISEAALPGGGVPVIPIHGGLRLR